MGAHVLASVSYLQAEALSHHQGHLRASLKENTAFWLAIVFLCLHNNNYFN
jgi:hypothetical protein